MNILEEIPKTSEKLSSITKMSSIGSSSPSKTISSIPSQTPLDTCSPSPTIFDNRIDKENEKRNKEGRPAQYRYARGYAGQFQAHYKGISKKRAIMGMHGRGGQHIVIDFENSRIVVTNSIYEDFNFKRSAKDILITSQLRTAIILNKNIKSTNYQIDTYKKQIYIYGIAITSNEKDLVISEAEEILDVGRKRQKDDFSKKKVHFES